MDNQKSVFTSYTGQYPVSKTLRNELIPVGRTLEHILREGLLKNDEKRALNLPNYQKKQLFLGKMQTKFRKYQKMACKMVKHCVKYIVNELSECIIHTYGGINPCQTDFFRPLCIK